MKLKMGPLQFLQRALIMLASTCGPVKARHSRNDTKLPLLISKLDRSAQGNVFNALPHCGDIQKIIKRDWSDTKTAAQLVRHISLRDQACQCFPKRRGSDLVSTFEFLDPQLSAGLK